MPIIALKDLIQEHLVNVEFRRPANGYTHSPNGGVKECILAGNGVDVTVLDEKSFSVNIQAERYYEALATSFFYSYEKISRQRVALDLLIADKKSPGAWMLVTAYYQAFYAAIELSRLMGIYNTSLDQNHLSRINEINKSSQKLSCDGVFVGSVDYLGPLSNAITIRFSKNSKTKPHSLAWSNLRSQLNKNDLIKNTDIIRQSRILTLKEIIDEKLNRNWPTPSILRNDWNYALLDAYSNAGDEKTSKLRYVLEGKDFTKVKYWADNRKRYTADDSSIISLGYVCIILETVLENIKSKLLVD